jgi:hypothetical protein
LFVVEAGELAVPVTERLLPSSAWTAVAKLVQPEGSEKPADL